jgi:hypothetical protein
VVRAPISNPTVGTIESISRPRYLHGFIKLRLFVKVVISSVMVIMRQNENDWCRGEFLYPIDSRSASFDSVVSLKPWTFLQQHQILISSSYSDSSCIEPCLQCADWAYSGRLVISIPMSFSVTAVLHSSPCQLSMHFDTRTPYADPP